MMVMLSSPFLLYCLCNKRLGFISYSCPVGALVRAPASKECSPGSIHSVDMFVRGHDKGERKKAVGRDL